MAETLRETFLSRNNSTLQMPDKPFIRRMLDPSSPTIESDGEEASVKTMSMDGKVFPTVVPQEQADGSYVLTELSPDAAYELAMRTGNYIDAGNAKEADLYSKVLSEEAGERRRQYKNNQAFLERGGRSLGDLEFRADVDSYVGDDALTKLGLELQRRGLLQLKGVPLDKDTRFSSDGYTILGGYEGTDSALRPIFKEQIALQNPLTKSSIMEKPNIATYVAGESDIPETNRPKGVQELTALHELRHGALDYLFNNTDLKKQKYFDKFDVDVEEDIMDMIDNRIIKDQNIPLEMDKVSKLDPKYIGGKERLNTITQYANDALSKFNVPERAEQERPSMLKRLLGMEQGGIMMAQQGQAVLPVTEATSAPQGGGPKAANPAAKPTLAPPPTKAPRPGSQDPRDEAMQEVAQELQADKAPQPAPPAPQPVQQPMQPVGGLAAPQQPPAVPMMAKGGTTDEKPEGLAVMIGLGAPTPSYEDAAEGNPPPGATKEEVADDQLVLLSEGELVVPANVVRYHGLGTYEGMRREALMGLQDMEQNGQIEYVSGGKEKADKIDDNGGIVKAQAGTYLAPPMGQGIANNPQFGINYAAPATYRPTTLVTPVAASSQFVKTPGQQTTPQVPSVLGMTGGVRALNTTNPLLLPYTPVIPSSVTGVYAPNVGEYQTAIDSGAQPETPEVPTVPTPTTPTPPPQDEGGGDRGQSPEEIAAQAEREGRIQDRKDAAAQLGYTKNVGIIEGLASSLGYGTPEIGTVMADGTIADGYGNTFDPITGKQVGFKGGIVGNIAGNLGLMDRETPAGIAANIPEASYAGLRSLQGEQSIANVLAEVGTPAQTIENLGVVAPTPGMMSPTVDELSTPPMDSAVASPSVQGLAAPTVDAGLPDELTGSPMGAANVMGTAQDAQFAGQTSSRGPTSSMSPGRSQAQFGTPAYAGIPTATLDSIAAAAAKASAPFSPEQVASMQAQIQQETTIRNDLISKGVPPSLASLQAKAQMAQSTQTGQEMDGLGFGSAYGGSPASTGRSAYGREGMAETLGAYESEKGAPSSKGTSTSTDSRVADRQAELEAQGHNSSYAGNKAKADIEAQDQTGNPNAKGVTDSKGNAVRDGNGNVVTSGNQGGSSNTSNTGGAKSGSGVSPDAAGETGDGCFAKGTLIMMNDGTQKPVEDVDIGDEVKLGGFVFATGKFLINNLYNYKGIEVSGSHMVLEDDKWLRVEDSELATLVSEDDTIVYVFGSENRRIVIDDVVFTDYFEVNEQEKLKQVGDSYFTNWKESAKITSKSNVEVRNTNDADAPTLAA